MVPTFVLSIEPVPALAQHQAKARTERQTCHEVWITYARRVRGKWTRGTAPQNLTREGLWDYIANLSLPGRRIYCVSQCASDMLTLTRFWDEVEQGRFSVLETSPGVVNPKTGTLGKAKTWVGKLVFSDKVNIITARKNGATLIFVSLSNYVNTSIRALSLSVGYKLSPSYCGDRSHPDPAADARDACAVVGMFYRRIVDDWLALRLGSWRETAGGLSLSAWRTLDGHRASRGHRDVGIWTIERGATHGGRASVWYYGDVGDPSHCPPAPNDPPPPSGWAIDTSNIIKIDVGSMYPRLLATERFPIQMGGVTLDFPVRDIPGLLRHQGAIAVVQLRSNDGEFPVRCAARTRYPLGTYTTTLAGPELSLAFDRGYIERVHRLVRYEMGTPFQQWGSYVLGLRQQSKETGDTARELLAKTIANSFGGKFAQNTDTWLARPRTQAPREWGEWFGVDAQTNEQLRYRAIAGVTHQRVPRTHPGPLPTAVYCYLTAYGRMMMRELRESLPGQCVLAQDTDGLVLDAKQLRQPPPSKGAGAFGYLPIRVQSEHSFVRFFDAKHYYLDGSWTLAGICAGWSLEASHTVKEVRTVNPARAGTGTVPRFITQLIRRSSLLGIQPDSRIGENGWAIPPVHGTDFNDILVPQCLQP